VSPGREAIGLPLLFLTVAFAGGLRLPSAGGAMHFEPPSLMSLVLAVLLVAAMVRGGLLVPHLLLDEERGSLANLSGAIVLATLLVASAQVFSCLTPPQGLLRLFFHLFFIALLWNTMAAQPDRPRLLRSLMVVFGSALVLRHLVFAALFDPQGSAVKRALVTLMEGVSLGTLGGEAPSVAEGYVAFGTLLLYLVTLVLLPRPPRVMRPEALTVRSVQELDAGRS
jgi:hypothetical protein